MLPMHKFYVILRYINLNLGWSSTTDNAWYASGIFDCRSGFQPYVSRSSDKEYYYQYKLRILPNVYY